MQPQEIERREREREKERAETNRPPLVVIIHEYELWARCFTCAMRASPVGSHSQRPKYQSWPTAVAPSLAVAGGGAKAPKHAAQAASRSNHVVVGLPPARAVTPRVTWGLASPANG
jgi:hypothetical protein